LQARDKQNAKAQRPLAIAADKGPFNIGSTGSHGEAEQYHERIRLTQTRVGSSPRSTTGAYSARERFTLRAK